MRAVVRSVRFPDLERGARFDPGNARELVEVYAGPSDGPGEESFCLTVCTPAALAEVLTDQPVLVGRHWLFVALPASGCRARRGPAWSEVAAKIGRLGLWEFEDYRP
jgi:hypothetical protein